MVVGRGPAFGQAHHPWLLDMDGFRLFPIHQVRTLEAVKQKDGAVRFQHVKASLNGGVPVVESPGFERDAATPRKQSLAKEIAQLNC